ncbi:MAG: hypothetical protein DSM106950_41460 [Stigonema ocellatum SAG 48.90 = DSM 106950]|nr:hypothetical protein [Stigonema ocellatum SAG 48.90 = DSM 106950]
MDFQPTNSRALATRNKSNEAGKLPRVQSFNPKLAALTNRYFGIDLENLDSMSDEQLAAYADMAKDAKRWQEIIPILEKHFQEIIEGQLAREQFYAEVQKTATQAGKKIDSNILQTYLAAKGYDLHLKVMSQKAYNGAARLDAEHRSAVQIELTDFQSYLQLVTHRHQKQEKAISGRVAQQKENEEIREQEQEQRQYRKDLLQNGTQAANKNRQRRRGGMGGIFDFFNGR